jgi:hypothetical protein
VVHHSFSSGFGYRDLWDNRFMGRLASSWVPRDPGHFRAGIMDRYHIASVFLNRLSLAAVWASRMDDQAIIGAEVIADNLQHKFSEYMVGGAVAGIVLTRAENDQDGHGLPGDHILVCLTTLTESRFPESV